jgi:hypothetical protein
MSAKVRIPAIPHRFSPYAYLPFSIVFIKHKDKKHNRPPLYSSGYFKKLKMFIPTKNIRSMQRASPPKRGAAEPVNLKTHRNPAKTAQRPFGLVRSRAHLFARISCVFKECASHRLGRWFSSFCRNKRTKKAKATAT